MSNENEANIQPLLRYLTRVKISNEVFEKISRQLLHTLKLDKETKRIIDEKIIKFGHYSYVGLIKKHRDFLTPVRIMILVDFVDILKAFKYYLNDCSSKGYNKNLSKDYNLISGLQAAELKIIMLEQLFELFEGTCNLEVIFHDMQEKIDAILQINEQVKISLRDNDGEYAYTLNPGNYVFESRSCCSVTDEKYILSNPKRLKYANEFERYFIFVPRDTTIYHDPEKELEKSNIKLILSDYSTIDIVNDVAFMEGILNRPNEEEAE